MPRRLCPLSPLPYPPGVRRTGNAVLHLFKEATQSYALIMRDPLTAGDIWKTLPEAPPEAAAAKRAGRPRCLSPPCNVLHPGRLPWGDCVCFQ